MRFLGFVWLWARRLPVRFTAVLIALMLLYLGFVSWLVSVGGETTIADALWRLLALPDIAVVRVFWEGLVVLALLAAGVLASYNLAALIYRKVRHRVRVVVPAPAAVPAASHDGTRLDGFNRIGIILAGGGAKGAYQAGAMKAIHEFLERNGALDKVAMIAGTSIGSWNAMFWLAGLVKPPAPGTRSLHEQWWRTIGVERIVEFDTYLPLRRNHFLLPTPWRETFRQIFLETPAVRDRLADLFVGPGVAAEPRMRFYFTRSNVERGHLEFATNWPGIRRLTRPNFRTADPRDAEPVVQLDRYEVIEGDDVRSALRRTELAVFASMDLPPLFPYMRITVDVGEWFEDGGVVENIPVWFGTQIERCDLLFVLPLNASFAEPVDRRSVTQRLFRVMDVRQGVLERNALKQTYLYNELAALRGKAEAAGALAAPRAGSSEPALEATALSRKHKPISVFAICPQQPLAIGTSEFWKPREAGEAFELMYAATRYELGERFEEDTNPNWIRMTLVSPQGERAYVDDF